MMGRILGRILSCFDTPFFANLPIYVYGVATEEMVANEVQ